MVGNVHEIVQVHTQDWVEHVAGPQLAIVIMTAIVIIVIIWLRVLSVCLRSL